jgi:hypothetical protein
MTFSRKFLPTQEERVEVCKLFREGKTYWEVHSQFPHLRQEELRRLGQMSRPPAKSRWNQTEAEIRAAAEEVRQSWEPIQWRERWVGRLAQRKDTDLQMEASRLLPY